MFKPYADKSRLQGILQKQGGILKKENLGIALNNNKGYAIIEVNSESNFAELQALKSEDIAYSLPVFRSQNQDVLLSNELYLELLPQASIKTLLDKLGNEVSLTYASDWHTYILELKNVNNILKFYQTINESGLVKFCVPNAIADIVKTGIPNDPLFAQQYYLKNSTGIDINAVPAWDISTGCNKITVAVIDDGVEDHEDLRDANGNSRVLAGLTPRYPNGNGRQNADCIANVRTGHGQSCAGIIAATQNNAIGISGIAPNVKIVPVNIFPDQVNAGVTFISSVSEGIRWASTKADILSNSWSFRGTALSSQEETPIREAITFARTQGRNGKGATIVFSSGNWESSFRGVAFPANVEGVIAVGAIGKDGLVTAYSSRGTNGLDLVAFGGHDTNLFPITIDNCLVGRGGDIFSTDRMNNLGYNDKPITTGTGYSYNQNYTEFFGGTSAACPQVSGAVALMLSIRPNLTEAQVGDIIRNTATKVNGQANFSDTYGYGRLNVGAALQATNSSTVGSATPPLLSGGLENCLYIINARSVGASSYSWSISPSTIAYSYYSTSSIAIPYSELVANGISSFQVTCNTQNYCTDVSRTQTFMRPSFPINAAPCPLRVVSGHVSSFTAFPNPTSGIINLSFDNLNQGIATISISNNLGIQVLQNQNLTLDKDNSTAINLSNLADGIYFLTVSFADGSQETRKIMLQKGNIAD
jgi:subtilisin family serine protease